MSQDLDQWEKTHKERQAELERKAKIRFDKVQAAMAKIIMDYVAGRIEWPEYAQKMCAGRITKDQLWHYIAKNAGVARSLREAEERLNGKRD